MLAFVVQALTAHRILHRRAVQAFAENGLALMRGAAHQRLDVDARRRDRQQTDRRQHGIASANVVGHDERLIALLRGKRLERAARAVSRGIDAALRTGFAVLFLKQLLEDAERDGRLRRRAGFGDDDHGEIPVADHGDRLAQRLTGDAVAREIDIRRLLREGVVVRALQKLYHRARTEIRAADADDDNGLRIALDLLRRLLDAGELFLVVVHRQVDPAEEIISRAGAVQQRIQRRLAPCRVLCGREALRSVQIDSDHTFKTSDL